MDRAVVTNEFMEESTPMDAEHLAELRAGFQTAYIDKTYASNLAYKPQFVSNNHKEGKKVLSSIED